MIKFSNLTLFGIGFFLLGAMCGIAENVFYGWVDSDGVLQESFFLPLSFIFAAIGAVLLITALLRLLYRRAV